MAEMILPGVYIEVRPEGLITPGLVSSGNLGVIGTASKGPLDRPVVIGSYQEAREKFGDYDPWIDGDSDELTLVRALEIAYAHGATTVFAMRVAGKTGGVTTATKAAFTLQAGGAACVTLAAKTEGSSGNNISVTVSDATENAFVEDEVIDSTSLQLSHTPVQSARNRMSINGRSLTLLYDNTATPTSGQVLINLTNGSLTFATGEAPAATDRVLVSYMAASSEAVRVTLKYKQIEEVYTVVSGVDLAHDINNEISGSALVEATADTTNGAATPDSPQSGLLSGGGNGAADAVYQDGLDLLLNQDVQIVLAAGQGQDFGNELDAHCQQASTDTIKRDRIAVVGSSGVVSTSSAELETVTSHTIASDRVILVAPGIKFTDAAATPPKEVTLPSAYAAAAVAGLLAGFDPEVSLTNKTLSVGGVEKRYTAAELTQLVKSRVLAIEERQGIRVVKGITTSTNTAWTQITTRRIVDYAKSGVRSAATPYIGLLNNDRVRGALKSTIDSFLQNMMADEMLVNYKLDVTATRAQERQGIVQVTITLQPVFSIDYIKVTMFLE